jgi:hypothetical protein
MCWHDLWCRVQVEKVKKECLPGASGLDCPLLEEYDFAHDTVCYWEVAAELRLRLAIWRTADTPHKQQTVSGPHLHMTVVYLCMVCCCCSSSASPACM